VLVTTTSDPYNHTEQRAIRLAEELHLEFVARSGRSLTKLLKSAGKTAVLVIGNEEIRYYPVEGTVHFFHPSMAMVRIKRLLAGQQDAMLKIACVKDGDQILDCTMGLASDTIVFAYAVGDHGKVTAIESELIPFVLAREGLSTYSSDLPQLNSAMRRIRTIQAEHLNYLRQLPDHSVDIVYFDPMFRRSASGNAIEPLRVIANHGALSKEAIDQAKRVARRAVVLKEHNRSGEFERLGFQFSQQKHAKITYGVINCGSEGDRS